MVVEDTFTSRFRDTVAQTKRIELKRLRSVFDIREFTKPRRQRQRQRQRERRQTKGLMSRTMAVRVPFESLYISCRPLQKKQREMTTELLCCLENVNHDG